jgi:RND superfamily putative drug exporter
VATVVFAALAALVLTPAAIVLLGDRLRGRAGHSKPVERQFWYRSTRFVLRRPVAIGLAVVTLLVLLGLPFTGVRWGFPDDRVLPAGASAHQVGDRLRDDFVNNSATAVTVVLPDSAGIPAAEMQRYVTELGAVIDVSAVSPPVEKDGSSYLTVSSTAPLFSDASETQLDGLHAVAAPAGREVLITGAAQLNRDSVDAITSRLPVVLGLIAVITFVLLFLLTGSLVLPLKALVLNVLSLSAAFGALVWIFQDGHLGAFGTTPTGTLVANIPVLLFCIAFGLSMDYEVFLLSRIREYWLASGRTAADVGESVALGLARTGRVVTAAALVMSISFAALIAANVSFMRMFGLGLAMAVLMDATLVRMMLVPAFMQVMGRWNWWAPKPLARLHDRFGFTD